MFSLFKSDLLHNKNFILLFLGGLISRIGSSIHYIALTWFVLDTTNSGTMTGIIMLLSTLPSVLIGPFAGVTADRINRKLLIVGMDITRALITLWLSWTIFFGKGNFYYLAIATVLIALSNSFFNPAVSATLPNIVKDKNLQLANSCEQFSLHFTEIIGAAVGGVLISLVGVAGVFMIDGLTYLLSALSELFIRIPVVKNKSGFTFVQDLKLGAKYLYQHKAILSLFSLIIILNFLADGIFTIGIPYLFKKVMAVNSRLFGIAQSIFPIGAIIGSIILSIIPKINNYYRLLISTVIIMSICRTSLGLFILPTVLNNHSLMVIYPVLLFILGIYGIANTMLNVPFNVLLQKLIPDNLRGRIFGLLGTFSKGLVPLSMALFGFLFDQVAAHHVFIIEGGLSIIFTLVMIKASSLKELKQLTNKNNPINYKSCTQN